MEAKPNDAATHAVAQHRHEKRDAPATSIFLLGGLFVILLVAGVTVSLVAFRYFTEHQPLGPPASPFENARTLPPAPQLQVTPATDWRDYQKAQLDTINSYGWVDQKAGIVRIPIDRAMALVLEKGLPTRHTTGDQAPGQAAGREVNGLPGAAAKPAGAQNQKGP